MKTNPPTFEDGLGKLEALVQKLEGGSLGLEDALRCFEEGINTSAALQKQLEIGRAHV
jgi:exodeoxyribonuclease VII small subunit